MGKMMIMMTMRSIKMMVLTRKKKKKSPMMRTLTPLLVRTTMR
jgi:hypothetical protein